MTPASMTPTSVTSTSLTPATHQVWSDLNLRLCALEARGGLNAALHELEAFHIESGFIRDTLEEVERFVVFDPADNSRFFRLQYNPRRALRFRGSGRQDANGKSVNSGCFLCRENIVWQQDGRQVGYRITSGCRAYLALTNPFPLMAHHMVLASTDHRPQDWQFAHAFGIPAPDLVHDLVHLAARLPGHVGFYNGVDAGASIAGHFHYQFVKRPEGEPVFPLEQAARESGWGDGGPALVTGYPLDAVVWRGRAEEVSDRASAWLAGWADRNGGRLAGLSANLICSFSAEDNRIALYFVPRDRARPRPDGFAGFVGGLEVLGEIVLSSAEERAKLAAAEIGYDELEQILASVRAPLYAE